MRDAYIRCTEVAIVVYSVTDRFSFEDVTIYANQFYRIKDADFAPLVFVATHVGFSGREVSKEEGQELASKFSAPFFEIDAREKTQVEEVILQAIKGACLMSVMHEKNRMERRKGKCRIC